ncbi:MAG: tRNA (adenosine(37)-N6)-threonylcarbamoyltransferase complex ATPase subunit type 1 TsaE [Chitinophagaceae bacterium]|nr:tRNA (adenosine(37)-N6)-threonylcarbamoyltransferase complex ATPase subunit type 1 TsaE [Chitinophagaceae bacterium]
MELVYKVDDIQQTAQTLWNKLKEARVFAFTGQMGAGKTTLIQAICREIGVKGTLSSPTFSIINEYQSPEGPIYHIDLYRCKNEDEVIRAGVEDCLYSGNICFIEWPSIAEAIFPKETVGITITETGNNTRKINVNRKLYAQTIS